MRIMTLAKAYRAFPELDRFSDRECQKFMARIVRGKIAAQVLWAGVAFVVGLGVWIGAWWAIRLSLQTMNLSVSKAFDSLPPWGIAAIVIGWFSSGFIAVFLVRDFWLGRELRRVVDVLRCECGYSVIGLAVEGVERDAAVLCPECGRKTPLVERGWKREQLEVRIESESGR